MTKKGRQLLKLSSLLFPVYLIAFICLKIGQTITLGFELPFQLLKIFFQRVSKIHFKLPKVILPAWKNPLLKIINKTSKLKGFFRKRLFKKKLLNPKTDDDLTPNLVLNTYIEKLPDPLEVKTKSIFARIPKINFRFLILIIFAALIGYSYLLVKVASDLPSPDRLTTTSRPLTSQIYDRNGKLLYQFYQDRNRKLVALSDLPPYLIDATVAIEDKHFYYHPGFDPLAMIRALHADTGTSSLQGASTITQQLIKNILLSPDQNLSRKVKEVVLAFWAERIYSKDQILQMYFNEIPYGGSSWGIEAASEGYFGKSAHDLTLGESAYLAGLPAAPSKYSPDGSNTELGKQRQKEVLTRMVEDGYITQRQADQAFSQPLDFKPALTDIQAPHFVMYVRSLLSEKYGERTVSEGGLKIVTTLDLDVQHMAEQVVTKQLSNLAPLKVGNAAAMITDAQNGQILAMVGSKNYHDPNGGNFNVALALRQPGSSIKPITYATAFKQGFSPGTILLDTPTTFSSPGGPAYSPVNYDGKFHGPVTLRTAFGSSFNIPAVKTLAIVGIPAMLQTAQDLGITTLNDPDSYGLSLTLGGGAVKLIDMMSVYGTFAANGVRHTPQPILKVTDPAGLVLEDNTQTDGQTALTEQVAYLISNILSDDTARTPAFGPHSLLQIPGRTVAVKTGTSDDKRDNWTFGYTPKYVVGIWVGNNDNSPMDPALTSGITGAAPIWHDIMTSLLADQPDIAFNRPAGIIDTVVDGNHDIAIAGQIPKNVVGFRTIKQKDTSGNEKLVTAYTDQFTTFMADIKPKPNP